MKCEGSINVYASERQEGLRFELYRTRTNSLDESVVLSYNCSMERARALFEAEVILIEEIEK